MTVFDAIGSTRRRVVSLGHTGRPVGRVRVVMAGSGIGPAYVRYWFAGLLPTTVACSVAQFANVAPCEYRQLARVRSPTGLRAVGIGAVTQSEPGDRRRRPSTRPIYIAGRTKSTSRRRRPAPTSVAGRPIRRLYRRDARKLLITNGTGSRESLQLSQWSVSWSIAVDRTTRDVEALSNIRIQITSFYHHHHRPDAISRVTIDIQCARLVFASIGDNSAGSFLCLRLAEDIGLVFLTGPSVRSSVTNLVNTIFWKRMDQFCHKLAQVVHGARG